MYEAAWHSTRIWDLNIYIYVYGINELIYKSKTGSQTQKRHLRLPKRER